MERKRFFGTICGQEGLLCGAEHLHCTRVLRHKEGYEMIVANGDGYDYVCRITSITPDATHFQVLSRVKNNAETRRPLFLFFSACKQDDWVVQKGVELGVSTFCPYLSARTVEKPTPERWEKIALGAAKQCGRACIPTFLPPLPFAEALQNAPQGNRIFCYELAQSGTIEGAISRQAATSLLIGPEGGFEEEEARCALENGFTPVTLGRRILRVETAVVAALTLTLQALGEL